MNTYQLAIDILFFSSLLLKKLMNTLENSRLRKAKTTNKWLSVMMRKHLRKEKRKEEKEMIITWIQSGFFLLFIHSIFNDWHDSDLCEVCLSTWNISSSAYFIAGWLMFWLCVYEGNTLFSFFRDKDFLSSVYFCFLYSPPLTWLCLLGMYLSLHPSLQPGFASVLCLCDAIIVSWIYLCI